MKIRYAVAAAVGLVSSPAFAIYTNGGFEANSFAGWTVGGGTNPALSGAPPFTGANVVIIGSTPGPASVVGAGADPRAPTLSLPRAGSFTAKVNDEGTGALITTVAQTDVITTADIDPADSLPHVRFSFAPVLEDPAHGPTEQPYFYVRVKNTTDNVVIFEQFAYSGQPGVSFINGIGSWKYLDFQNVDATVPISALNKSIETYLVAADCSQTGHGGYVYLDGFGSATVPPIGGPVTRVQTPALSPGMLALLAGAFAALGFIGMRRTDVA
jgi:hypothetical protein